MFPGSVLRRLYRRIATVVGRRDASKKGKISQATHLMEKRARFRATKGRRLVHLLIVNGLLIITHLTSIADGHAVPILTRPRRRLHVTSRFV